MKYNKLIINILFWFSIAATCGQLIWVLLDMIIYKQDAFGSLFLNVIAYGLPILVSAWACREWKKEQPRWHMEDNVLGGLLALSFIVMVIHVTIYGLLSDFINSYFNLPIIYTIPIVLFGFVWWIVRIKPTSDTKLLGKILYALPIITICAMIVHCTISCIVEIIKTSIASGAPWWVMPLIIGLIYLVVALLLLIPYLIYTKIQKRKNAN